MRRGDLVTVTVPGDFGKHRPALVIQSDRFDEVGTVTVLLLSSTLVEAPLLRLTIDPARQNGLRATSQIMIDKAMTVRRDRIGKSFGRVDDGTLLAVNRSIALFFGLA